MRIISIFLCLCLSMNVLASSGTIQELERSFDNYQYTLTVEWDQKDVKFQEAATKKFFEQLSELQQKGLEKEQILALAEKKMANKEAFEAMKLKLGLLSNVKSSSELAQVLKDSSKDFYQQGASWNGSAILEVGIYVFLAAAIGYAIWFGFTHECVEWDEREEYSCSEESYTDYDEDGFPYTVYTGFEECGWYTSTVCTQYVKKE